MTSVAIVAPLYKKSPSANEVASLTYGFNVLRNYPRYLAAPVDLDLAAYGDLPGGCNAIRFEPKYFRNVKAYNRLLLSISFYKYFKPFEFLLVFQPDAFVFYDALEYWCNCDYDYIGAPWPNGSTVRPLAFRGSDALARVFPWFNKPVLTFIGNGGLSLRKVSSAIDVLRKHWLLAKLWGSNEDTFWSLYSRNVPDIAIASRFSLEQAPSEFYHANNEQLPLGCHAWEKYDPEFWRDHLKGLP